MPLYEYACTSCQHHFDLRHGADEKPELCCPQCQGAVKKVFHAAGIIFKGSGWYVTDSAPKKDTGTEVSETKSESKSDTKSESKEKTTAESKETAKTPASV